MKAPDLNKCSQVYIFPQVTNFKNITKIWDKVINVYKLKNSVIRDKEINLKRIKPIFNINTKCDITTQDIAIYLDENKMLTGGMSFNVEMNGKKCTLLIMDKGQMIPQKYLDLILHELENPI